jgi:SAM-dependent methyltransferase
MIDNHDPRNSHQSLSNLEYSGTEELIDSEEGLARYNRDVVKKIAQGFRMNRHAEQLVSVLEFGAGTGVLAEIWESDYAIRPTCVEIAPSLLKILTSKGFKTLDNIEKLTQRQSFIYTSNVLEHIEDDLGALREIRNHLEIDGKLAIYVPALPILFSDLDKRLGHFRRYKRRELISKVESAGFRVEYCYYNDCLGVLASLSLRIVGYKNKAGLGSKKSLIFYDNVVYPISIILDKIVFKYLIGKNLLLIATNPKS